MKLNNSGIFINVIGGGLAGSEAVYQLAKRGYSVRLYEMRPNNKTPAHNTGNLAELVCSNTFKSILPHTAPGIFKSELTQLDSLILTSAIPARVPAGEALAVDRDLFSKEIEARLSAFPNIEKFSSRVETPSELPPAYATIIATGPLTQGELTQNIFTEQENNGLYFYDAIAPVVAADSINRDIVFAASRYGKGTDDYLNCPMTKEEYEKFYHALCSAEKMEFQDFESAKYFQGCQPIEAIAETGPNSLRFGPMKPVGLTDPRNGNKFHAIVQLRIDNVSRSSYNLVGFQTKLKYNEQKKVFSMIPGLENAEFHRFGSMHRNTYICTPNLLNQDFSLKKNPTLFFAGQITGVEGYTESSSIGLLVALAIDSRVRGIKWELPPQESVWGALSRYLFRISPEHFQPMNVNFSLFSEDDFSSIDHKIRKLGKKEWRSKVGERCLQNIREWKTKLSL